MRNPNRIEDFCDDLAAAWHRIPDWRFGQLIENCFIAMKNDKIEPFYLEDNEMINYIIKYLNNVLGEEVK